MMKFYKVMHDVFMLMYWSECSAMNKADRRQFKAAEMKFL
jgi:hypothetical protein